MKFTNPVSKRLFAQFRVIDEAVRRAYKAGRQSAIEEAEPHLEICPKCGDCKRDCDNCDWCGTSPKTGT